MTETTGTEGTENTGTTENPATEPTPKSEKPVAEKVTKPKSGKSPAKAKAKPAVKKGKDTQAKAAPKAKAVKVKKAAPKTEKATGKTPKAKPAVTTDRQLPKIGETIQKLDRNGAVRAKCQVVVGGILYKGTVYPSLSSAAMAAAKDLGLGSTAQNGWVFWQLKATPSATDPVEALLKASERFIERAGSIVVNEENKAEVAKIMKAHRTAFERIAG